MTALAKTYISEDEYARGEELSEIKHEWFNGEVFAMASGTPTHAFLCTNVSGALRDALKGKACRAVGSELRVKVEANGLRTYPDAMVICPPERYDARDPNSLLNPKVLVEVLSPSTESYDRTGKFDSYKQIETLTDYLLISADRVRVEHFSRAENGLWTQQVFVLRSQSVALNSVEIEVSLDEIYERVELPEGLQIGLPEREREADV